MGGYREREPRCGRTPAKKKDGTSVTRNTFSNASSNQDPDPGLGGTRKNLVGEKNFLGDSVLVRRDSNLLMRRPSLAEIIPSMTHDPSGVIKEPRVPSHGLGKKKTGRTNGFFCSRITNRRSRGAPVGSSFGFVKVERGDGDDPNLISQNHASTEQD